MRYSYPAISSCSTRPWEVHVWHSTFVHGMDQNLAVHATLAMQLWLLIRIWTCLTHCFVNAILNLQYMPLGDETRIWTCLTHDFVYAISNLQYMPLGDESRIWTCFTHYFVYAISNLQYMPLGDESNGGSTDGSHRGNRGNHFLMTAISVCNLVTHT
jgi:hypothetical protein